MFTEYNTEGYAPEELDKLNGELQDRLMGIDDPDDIDRITKDFLDEVSRR